MQTLVAVRPEFCSSFIILLVVLGDFQNGTCDRNKKKAIITAAIGDWWAHDSRCDPNGGQNGSTCGRDDAVVLVLVLDVVSFSFEVERTRKTEPQADINFTGKAIVTFLFCGCRCLQVSAGKMKHSTAATSRRRRHSGKYRRAESAF